MPFFDGWYSDGWYPMLALTSLGIFLFAIFINAGKKCKPIAGVLPWAVIWHLAVFSYYVLWMVPYYGNVSDALGYHERGIQIASSISASDWGSITWGLSTSAVDLITGFMYLPFGADPFGIAFFSAALGFGAGIYFCRAFNVTATPEQTKKYSMIVLFMPSIAVWTGLFGKDSWVALGLGLAAYGYASMQKSVRSTGIFYLLAGFIVAGIVRPHIALAIAVSMSASYTWGLTQRTRGSVPMKVLRIVVLTALIAVLYPLTLKLVGLTGATAASMEEYMRSNSEANAAAGGSVVEVHVAPGVIGAIEAFPRGVVRVLLQPFPWEVRNVNSALASLENIFIAFLLIRYARHFRGLIRAVVREPYFLFSGFLTLALLAMFSYIPNLGLLSRERVQLLPFLFALLVAGLRGRPRPASLGMVSMMTEASPPVAQARRSRSVAHSGTALAVQVSL